MKALYETIVNWCNLLLYKTLKEMFVLPFCQVIEATLKQTERWILTKEGTEMATEGSYEATVFNYIKDGVKQADLMVGKGLFTRRL